MAYDGGISSVLNNKLTYKFKVGKYLDSHQIYVQKSMICISQEKRFRRL